MTLSTRRRIFRACLALPPLLCGLPERCSAEIAVADVSRERAKELGITVRLLPRENDVRVQVEFRAAGALKGFKYADLELTRGEKRLVNASLMPRKPARDSTPESTQLEFYIDPEALPGSAVMIVVYSAPLTGEGYRLRMKDFIARAASR